ncbi:MAG: bifunctional metallophosphatase/5'-nucleotidase, partial [Clostridia bacterium]|nr:bifunctional metallophosphatase/5'-nucleotidase [Clostridia bacterium]
TILEDSGKLDNQVLIDYIQSMPEVDGKHVVTGYTDPKGEGRIKIVTEAEPTGDTIVLFTNDVHCGIRDGWGYAGVADLKKTLEKHGNEVILVDAGDHIQGGPIGSLTKGEAIIDIMNAVGYDLATLGNHEFDYGMDQLFTLIEKANYPYLSANFMDLETNEAKLDAYKIIEANGKKIAFVGLSTPESITKSTPTYFMNEAGEYIYGFCQDDTGAGVYTAAQAAIDAAKAAGADYVIIVGHMGIDEQSQPWTAPEVIANVTGVDAFIDGHSHSVINTTVKDKDNKDVLHGQTGTKLANVGKLTIKADGTMSLELLPASEKVKDDPEVDAVISAIEAEFEALLNSVVAYTDHDLTVNDPDTGARAVRSAETNLGDLCADAYRYMFDADVAFVNGGGVRANIPTGDITFQQIINVHPFGNTAVLAEVTGQQILDALEMGARVCPSENGGFLQVAGLTYEIHTYLDPNCVVGSDKMWQGTAGLDEYRVKNVKVLNKTTGEYEALDLAKKYTLASHNYMLKDMGDGFAMFGSNITILEDSGKLDNQVLID